MLESENRLCEYSANAFGMNVIEKASSADVCCGGPRSIGLVPLSGIAGSGLVERMELVLTCPAYPWRWLGVEEVVSLTVLDDHGYSCPWPWMNESGV